MHRFRALARAYPMNERKANHLKSPIQALAENSTITLILLILITCNRLLNFQRHELGPSQLRRGLR